MLTYEKAITGLVVSDPYNDFISEGGKRWAQIMGVAERNQCVPHMKQILEAARRNGIRVFYATHRRYRPSDYETWKYIAPIQKAAWSRKSFEYGTWGGEIRAEFAPGSRLTRSISWPRSTGVSVASPARIWICSSRSTALKRHRHGTDLAGFYA